jgi:hypothetical protein
MEENAAEVVKKKRPWWKRILRLFMWTGISVLLLLGLAVLLLFVFEDDVKKYITAEANKHLNTVVFIDPKDINLTLFSSFPDVSLEFKNVKALDALPDEKRDTLFKAERIALSFSLLDFFRENYTVRDITMENAAVELRIDKKGRDNYHFLKTTADTGASNPVAFALEHVGLENVRVLYYNQPAQSTYEVLIDELNCSGDFGTEQYVLQTDAGFTVGQLKQGNASYFAGNKGTLDLALQINNTQNLYTVQTGRLTLSQLELLVSGSVNNKANAPMLDLAVTGNRIDLGKALTLLPESLRKDIEDYKATGEFYTDITVKGAVADTAALVVEGKFGIRSNGTLSREGTNVSMRNIALKGVFSSGRGRDGFELSEFSAGTGTSKFSGRFAMDGYTNPSYTASLNGNINLAEMQELFQLDTIEKAAGNVELRINASGRPGKGSTLTAADFRNFKTSGEMTLRNVVCRLKNSALPVDSLSGALGFDGNNVAITNLRIRSGPSDLVLNGKLRNLLGFLFTQREVLDITANLRSELTDLNALLSAPATTKSSDTSYSLTLPERIAVSISAQVGQVKFRKFDARDLRGELKLRNQRLVADPVSFWTMDGKINGSGMIDGTRTDSLLITGNAHCERVNINKLFVQLENFGQTTLTNEHVRGTLTSDLNFASLWSTGLVMNEQKLFAGADVTIDQGQLINFKPLEELSRFIKLDDLRNIRFSTLTNHIDIRNRIITIPEMDIRSSAIDITMSGTHNFDNVVDYHIVVGLDELRAQKVKKANPVNAELGIVEEDDGGHRTKLYILMSGPLDNPDIRYDSKGLVRGIRNDLKQEKQDLKQLLREEFGWFKKDSTLNNKKPGEKPQKKNEDGKFIIRIEQGEDEEAPPEDDDF